MNVKSQVIEELDSLIEKGKELDDSFYSAKTGVRSSKPESEHRSFLTASLAAISRIAGRDSEYFESAPKPDMDSNISSGWSKGITIPAMLGSLSALKQAVDSELLQSIESRLRASVHDDFLEQAKELEKSGYHVAAVVLASGVLENHLRNLCSAKGLNVKGSGSLSKYNDLLKDNVYPQTVWRRVQSVGDVRNLAAHGKGDKVEPDDVTDSINFISRLLVDHPT
ncbi:DUF4145 domain-containing protein [Longimonas halophila]|uniref:DUF4145 domain-containing protein n=1 Tax=Longimonas halophila TaxID=1469170 RepID=UPI001143BAD6|nr:DUF4145 domain-containing protein [Longimonas halophila]